MPPGAAADDRAAADSEQAGQREKDPVATTARATPGWPTLERIVPLECSPLITSTPRTPKKNSVKPRTARVQFAGSTFAFRAAEWWATLPAYRTLGRRSQGHPTSLDLPARP